MFSRNLSAFLRYAPFDFSLLTRGLPSIKPFVGAGARKWPGDMKLSDRTSRPRDYESLQRSRRSALESILREETTDENVRDAMDLICAICEESSWAATQQDKPVEPFDDESFPPIDFSCAETAVLFGWTACILGEHLDAINPMVMARMLSEVRKRLFRSTTVHEDYPFMLGESAYSLTIAIDVAVAAIFLERDAGRLSRLLRGLFEKIDALSSGADGGFYVPLEESVTDVSSIADLVCLIQRLTNGAVDLSRTTPDQDRVDEILFSWISEDYFVDPAGGGMKPQISGSDVFRVGKIVGDRDLAALGSQLHRLRKFSPRTVTGRMLESMFTSQLEVNIDKPPRLKYAVLRGNRLMAVRMNGLYCALHTGGGLKNAGEIGMFMDGSPLIPFMDRASEHRNLPRFNDQEQLDEPVQPCIADFASYADRETLSIDLTSAYPEECALASYQRTVISMRNDYTLRVVEALRFTSPSTAAFSFICAARPTVLSTAVRIGQIRLTWEGDLQVSQTDLGDGLTELTFTTPEPVSGNMYTFNFELP